MCQITNLNFKYSVWWKNSFTMLGCVSWQMALFLNDMIISVQNTFKFYKTCGHISFKNLFHFEKKVYHSEWFILVSENIHKEIYIFWTFVVVNQLVKKIAMHILRRLPGWDNCYYNVEVIRVGGWKICIMIQLSMNIKEHIC